jgi:hypothetical protein
MGIGGKARLGRDADHSPPFSAEVKNEQELYFLSLFRLHGGSWTALLSVIVKAGGTFRSHWN